MKGELDLTRAAWQVAWSAWRLNIAVHGIDRTLVIVFYEANGYVEHDKAIQIAYKALNVWMCRRRFSPKKKGNNNV